MRAIVFDLDDTLYPEIRYVVSGFAAVARWAKPRLGIPEQQGVAELRALFEAGERFAVIDRWLAGHDMTDPALTAEAVAVYRGHDPDIAPAPGVDPMLRRLRRRFLLGLVTDGRAKGQRKKLHALGIRPLFHEVVFSDDLGRDAWKPSPLPFMKVLDELGVAPDDSVYVADNPHKDFLGARRAGMRSVRVRSPEGIYSRVEPATREHEADAEVEHVLEVEALADQVFAHQGGGRMPTNEKSGI